MSFGEKIYKLRKEKGFSQEALAERLGTTRQAVSKWENNQGLPETEKLLQLSNIFEVSIDFLLKDEKTLPDAEAKGYYVSGEMARGFIANQKKLCVYIGVGFMAFLLAGIPYVIFDGNSIWRTLGMAVCIVAGIASIVIAMFSEQPEYNVLKRESLLFDCTERKELEHEYYARKARYIFAAIPCTILFVSGLIVLLLTAKDYLTWSKYHAFVFLGFALGMLGFVYSIGMIETYELLVKNEQYTATFFFKLKGKVRKKIEEALR